MIRLLRADRVRHAKQLDGLRALAVSIVILSHAGLGSIVPGGFGVTIFFFLSGFLITSLLRAEAASNGAVDLRAFYARRFVRILPSLWITMALVAVLAAAGLITTKIGSVAIATDLLFMTNYAYLWTSQNGLPIPLWSLDVEEHFYLMFPLLFLVSHRFVPLKGLAAFVVALCAAILLLRIYNVMTLTDYTMNYYWSHTRIDSILFGSLLAFWNNPLLDEKAWRPRFWQFLAAVSLLGSTFLIRDQIFRESIRYSIQGSALFVVFSYVICHEGTIGRTLSSSPMRWIGLFSYTLYLCHVPALMIVEQLVPSLHVSARNVAGIILAIIYSGIMYFVVERPLSKWRRSLHARSRPATI